MKKSLIANGFAWIVSKGKSLFVKSPEQKLKEAKEILTSAHASATNAQKAAMAAGEDAATVAAKTEEAAVTAIVQGIESTSKLSRRLAIGGTVAVGSVLASYPYARMEGYTIGRTAALQGIEFFGGGESFFSSDVISKGQVLKSNPGLITQFGSGVFSILEAFGNSKADQVSDAFVNGVMQGYTSRYNALSEEERAKLKLPTPREFLDTLAQREPHLAVRTSMREYNIEAGVSAGSGAKAEGETAKLIAAADQEKINQKAKAAELEVAQPKFEAIQQGLLAQQQATEQDRKATLTLTTQNQEAVRHIADSGAKDNLEVQARTSGGYKPETLAQHFSNMGLLKSPADLPKLSSAFAAIAIGNNKTTLDKAAMEKIATDQTVTSLTNDQNLVKLQVRTLSAELR